MHKLEVITADPYLLCIISLYAAADAFPSAVCQSSIILHQKEEETKDNKEMLHETDFTFTLILALSPPPSLSFLVCVSDGIHVPDLFRRAGNGGD